MMVIDKRNGIKVSMMLVYINNDYLRMIMEQDGVLVILLLVFLILTKEQFRIGCLEMNLVLLSPTLIDH